MITINICMLIAFGLCFCIGVGSWVKSLRDDNWSLHRISRYIMIIAIAIGIVLIIILHRISLYITLMIAIAIGILLITILLLA